MRYFLANLAVHIIVNVVLIVLIVVFSNRNRHGKTRYPVSYFIPTVLAVIVAIYAYNITWPRLLDLSDVASRNYYSYTGEVSGVSVLHNYIVIDGETYYINPTRNIPEAGSKVRIRYTRYGNYIIDVDPVDDLDITGAINDELETAVDIPGKTP